MRLQFDTVLSVARVTVGGDSLHFDLGRLAGELAGKASFLRNDIPREDLSLRTFTTRRKGALVLHSLSGRRERDTLRVERWAGKLLLGRPTER